MSRYSCREPAALEMENLVCQKINHSLATIYKIFLMLKCLSILVVNLLFTEMPECFSNNHGKHTHKCSWPVQLTELCVFGSLLFCLVFLKDVSK